METQSFAKGHIILEDGTDGEEIFFIMSGKVRIFKNIGGSKIILSTLGPGDFFGEMSTFLNRKRTASVEAVEDTEVLVGDKAAFVETIEKNPAYAVQVISTMAKRLHEAHQLISSIEGQVKAYEILLTPYGDNEPKKEKGVPDIIKRIRNTLEKK